MIPRRLYAACFGIHFFLIAVVCGRELLFFLAHGPTIFPPALAQICKASDEKVAAIAATKASIVSVSRAMLSTYLNLAGVEAGYGFFAPNVPDSYRVILELHYSDGHVEYRLPGVHSHAAGLRIAGLLDQIGRSSNPKIRKIMVALLAHSVWRDNPDATSIRAMLTAVSLPSIDECARGIHRSDHVIAAYDLNVADDANPREQP